jgi:YfiH family protein
MMQWKWFNKGGINYISLEDWLSEGVNLAFSARQGGVSEGVYNSLNMGLHVGDQPGLVLENRSRYLNIFDARLDDVVCCQQVHGNHVTRIDRIDRGRGARDLEDAVIGCDSMITNSPGVYLLSFYADCVPVYFYDPVNRAIGMAHCGWKGTLGKIAPNTLAAMNREYNTSPDDVRIFIGPGIGPCCFEVQPDLAAKVNAEFNILHDIIINKNKGIFTWDLQETNNQLLINCGVKPSHICVCRLCTSCNIENFYSYRKEKSNTGRMGALLGLQN